MDKQKHLILWHWEALYPYESVNKGISSLQALEGFPTECVYIALPHDYLLQAWTTWKETPFRFGSSHMLPASSDTFTSSVAAQFLIESHACFVMLGKAFERNQIKELPASVNDKVKAALKAGITVFVCFGETREEFEDGLAEDVVKKQLSGFLADLSLQEIQSLYFLYDTPGALKSTSGVTSKNLDDVYTWLKKQYRALWGNDAAEKIKTVCAVEPYKPLSKEVVEHSAFVGFYFKMIDANVSCFSEIAKQVAPFFNKALRSEVQSEVQSEEVSFIEGEDSIIEGEDSIVEGEDSLVEGEDSIVEGEDSLIEGEDSILEGEDSIVEGEDSLIEGEDSIVEGEDSIVEGEDSILEGEDSIIEGEDSIIEGEDSIIEGEDSIIEGEDSILEGEDSLIEGEDSIVEGEDSIIEGEDSIIEGEDSILEGEDSTKEEK